MANVTGWGRSTWGSSTWGEPVPVDVTGLAATGAVGSVTVTGDASVVILDFGALKTATAGTFTVAFPAADASNAIIRIA